MKNLLIKVLNAIWYGFVRTLHFFFVVWTTFRNFVHRFIAYSFWILLLVIFVYMIYVTPFNMAAWSAYANVKQSAVIWNLVCTFFPFVAFEKAYPGNTISSIMQCDKPACSSWDRLIACLFMLGILFVSAYVVTST